MKIHDVIVCDDIRTEIANKFSLIGIYFDKIRLTGESIPAFPIPFRLGLMIRILLSESDSFPQEFKIRYKLNNEELMVVEGNVKLDKGNKVRALNLPIIAVVPIPKLGTLKFSIEFTKEGKETYSFPDICSIEISSDSPQLSFAVPPA